MFWGTRSNGRAPALYPGSTGIDTRILQDHDFYNNGNNVLHFRNSFPFVVLFSSFICLQNAGNASRRPAQYHCITFTLHSTGTTTKGSFRLLSITQLWSDISIAGN